ncbi:amidohydrolase family protein [Dactylosporangium sp. NPDC005572]|uniref:amidohydrolase family protein n=1 Tax=Dactylosporangium sp. NPDC005572 TaxID=3156889 RepID=UPI0033B06D18
MKTVIKHATIATMDPVIGELPTGDILIQDGRIEAVEPQIDTDAEIIDATGMIAIPGLIDTHRHTWQTALRGLLADGVIPDYIRGVRLQMAPRYRPEDMYWGNYAGALDALNMGVTTIVDYCHNIVTPDHAHEAIRGLRDSGVRALYGHGLSPINENTFAGSASGQGQEASAFKQRLATARALRSEYFSSTDQRLTFGICPQELLIAPPEEVAEEFATARELSARLVFHANQVCVRQLFHDVELLHARGLLGPDLLLVHCTFNTRHEWELLREYGVSVSVCPETEMQMGMGFPAIREATEYTAGPGIAIDCVSGAGGDLITEARLVLQAVRWRTDEPGYNNWLAPQQITWTTREALTWATINGARCAGLESVTGSLTPGKRADVVLLDARSISMAGWNRLDPIGAVVAHMNAGNVHTVLVDGQVVKRDGALVHADTAAAIGGLESSREYLMANAEAEGGFIPQPPVDIPLYREHA